MDCPVRIGDPYDYLFKVRNVEETFRDMNEAVLREVVGDRTVTEVLTIGRQDIEVTAQIRPQALCDQFENGIRIEQVVLQDVNPPDPVKRGGRIPAAALSAYAVVVSRAVALICRSPSSISARALILFASTLVLSTASTRSASAAVHWNSSSGSASRACDRARSAPPIRSMILRARSSSGSGNILETGVRRRVTCGPNSGRSARGNGNAR
jgi:hypothetical protein